MGIVEDALGQLARAVPWRRGQDKVPGPWGWDVSRAESAAPGIRRKGWGMESGAAVKPCKPVLLLQAGGSPARAAVCPAEP